MFETDSLRLHAPKNFNERRSKHQHSRRNVSKENIFSRAGPNQRSEEPWRRNSTRRGSKRIEKGNRQSADFQRENLAYGEVGGTGRGGRKEDAMFT